jgi:hypothetical protein
MHDLLDYAIELVTGPACEPVTVDEAKRQALIEHLDMGGYPPATTPAAAIDLDWLAVLAIGQSDAAEALRYTAPEDERERRRLGLRAPDTDVVRRRLPK